VGLKHVETIKSIVLVFLIGLSLTLTFSIWNYTPNLETIGIPDAVDIKIAEKKDIESIVKPYKILFNFKDRMNGTTDTEEIDNFISSMKNWTVSDLSLEDAKFNEENLNVLLREKDRITLFFPGEIPFMVYNKVVNMSESNIPILSFDRIVIEWNAEMAATSMHFINKEEKLRYSAKVKTVDIQALLMRGQNYASYVEASPNKATAFIAVPEKPVEVISNTFIEAEISISKFRDALFSDPNAVRRSQIGLNHEEFQDDHALMSIDTNTKRLHYVHPVAESNEPAIPEDLLLKTIEFMNEHGGWTDEFRYSHMNPSTRYVKYQLFVHGLPVYSDTTSTEIEQVWGENRIFRYMRPYYTLDLTLPSETETEVLLSGPEVVKRLVESDEVDFNDIDEISTGYFMKHDKERQIFLLEPSWYFLTQNTWIRFSPEQAGGERIGLE